jgi:anti-sigma B factor antagonist
VAIEFRIDDEDVDGETHVVAVTGEIDLFTVPEFKKHIAAAIEAGTTRIVVDLGNVTFIDSSSLGVLIDAHKRLARGDGSLVIVCHDRAIMNTFRITGLDEVFEIVGSRDDIVTSG